ncbi:hypothetical protein C4K35_3115 [Pseudomonas chlororaphis subsp. piscium]|nr:hypothetical protein C4K35_3115 [Pseudomonas chlororaphis subsp. piscium]AZC95756.1 hypothetical protein C4K28_3028 [Pseudomonas chlororaphis subsp. piscium]
MVKAFKLRDWFGQGREVRGVWADAFAGKSDRRPLAPTEAGVYCHTNL